MKITLKGRHKNQKMLAWFLSAAMLIATQFVFTARSQTTTTEILCGTVTSFTPPSTAEGSITIGGKTFNIAPGTTITGANLIVVGASVCIMATLDSSGVIVAPVEARANTATVRTFCGMITAMTAATSTTTGSITLAGQAPLTIAAGAIVTSTTGFSVGNFACLEVTMNAFGQIFALQQTSTAFICGMVTAFTAATAGATGSLAIGGQTFQIAQGTTIGSSNLVMVGQNACLVLTFNPAGAIVSGTASSATAPPTLTIPGPQMVAPGTLLTLVITATGHSPGETVTISTGPLPTGASFNPSTGQFSFTPSAQQAGQTFAMPITATGSSGDSITGTLVVQVVGSAGPGGAVAEISAPRDMIAQAGRTVTFRVVAVDSGGNPVTLAALNLPQGATFDQATGTLTFTPSTAQIGQDFTIIFEQQGATAGQGVSATVHIQVVASGGAANPQPPLLSLPQAPVLLHIGTTLVLPVVAMSSTAGCSTTISATGLPPFATFDAATGTVTLNPTADQANKVFFVTFTATDCNNLKTSQTVALLVASGSPTATGSICVPVNRISFAPTVVGTSCGAITVTIFNLGSGTLVLNSASLADNADFHIVGGTTGAIGLQAGGTMQITIVFQPTTHGKKSDTLTINSNDPNQPSFTITLTGKGVAM